VRYILEPLSTLGQGIARLLPTQGKESESKKTNEGFA